MEIVQLLKAVLGLVGAFCSILVTWEAKILENKGHGTDTSCAYAARCPHKTFRR